MQFSLKTQKSTSGFHWNEMEWNKVTHSGSTLQRERRKGRTELMNWEWTAEKTNCLQDGRESPVDLSRQ